ncbi:MAG: Flp pilus assembly complex ATPase component TadA [Halobacteriovoraceae bacterium]|nr:Flp pilus assembly complex ATPase component TadA [Halobacteriovoraceae bacterium]
MFSEEFFQLVSNSGMATYKELKKISVANKHKEVIGEFDLLDLEGFDDVKFASFMADKFNYTMLDLKDADISEAILGLLQKKHVTRYRLIPIQQTEKKVVLTSFDPLAQKNLKSCTDILGKNADFVLTTIGAWKELYNKVKMSLDEVLDTIKEFEPDDTEQEVADADENINSDVVSFVNRILADSFIRKASDIHVEPYEKKFRIRFRIDGNLIEVAQPPKTMIAPMISRLKIMAKLDISEKRKPQDGRIKLSIANMPIDYRVSCLPTLFGEKIVMRLLDQSNLQLDMTKLGFMNRQLATFKDCIYRPYGMCLVTGPTGSGKTTTLYSAMQELNKPSNNISTAEDPCEFNLEGINQVNIRKDIGLTFASVLKSFLRQDPDIIMVGEIRDLEVGEIAVEAALTGHLVFSTLHTNDAASTVTRLLNMGIEPFLVVASLNVVVAQRLCKRICKNCRVELPNKQKELIACGMAPESADAVKVFKGEGCEQCNGTGYKGRVAIHEVLPMSNRIRELILNDASAEEIKRMAIYEGMRTLRMSALIKVTQGITTLEEAVSNSSADNLF